MRFRLREASPRGYTESKLRRKKAEALKKLSGYRIETLFEPRIIAMARSVADQDETAYSVFYGERYVFRGLGNGVTYLQISAGNEVRHAYYLDLQSGQAVDALDLKPEVKVLAGENWFYDVRDRFVSFPSTFDSQAYGSPEILNVYVMLSPPHELMHALREDINNLVSLLANWQERRQISGGLPPGGPDEERTATDMSLSFIRQARVLGVDIARNYNVTTLLKIMNQALSNYRIR